MSMRVLAGAVTGAMLVLAQTGAKVVPIGHGCNDGGVFAACFGS